MNQNPWYVDNIAQYERDRIRSEMKQIRVEENARAARPRAERLALRVWHLLFKGHVGVAKRAVESQQAGAPSPGVTKRHARQPR